MLQLHTIPPGWAQPKTTEELEAFIAPRLGKSKWKVDPQLLKSSVLSQSAAVIRTRDFHLYLQEYIKSLGLPFDSDN